MVNYIKTTNGYFYKICKNGKKRISEDEYNKQRKIKKMTGGVEFNNITIVEPNSSREVMENVFLTGDISANGRTSTISKITKNFMDFLTHVKTNNNRIGKQRRIDSNLNIDITYVGEIRYAGKRPSSISGTSNIWVQRNYDSKKVRYIVQIKKGRNNDYDTSNFGKHVEAALKTLSTHENIDLLIPALSRIGVQLDGSRELINLLDEKSQIQQRLSDLEKEKMSLMDKFNRIITTIDWTFIQPR